MFPLEIQFIETSPLKSRLLKFGGCMHQQLLFRVVCSGAKHATFSLRLYHKFTANLHLLFTMHLI